MKRLLPWLVGYFLLNAIDGVLFVDRLIYYQWDGKPGDNVTKALNLLFLCSEIVLFGWGMLGSSRKLPSVGVALATAFVGLLIASALWSTDPTSTLWISLQYFSALMALIGVARTLRAGQFMQILTWVCVLAAVMSVLLLIASPVQALNLTPNGAEFRGTFPHKNVLGQSMMAGTLSCLYCLRTDRRSGIKYFLALALLAAMLVASKCTTALLVAVTFVAINLYFWSQTKGGSTRQIGKLAAIGIAPLLLLGVFAPDTILAAIGKDPTLTGRTEIWSYVWGDICQKPLLGWGYFGFWSLRNPAALVIDDAVKWVVPEAHNGLLEILVSIGFIGTALVLLLLGRNLLLGYRCLGGPERDLGIAAIMCCIGLLMEGVSEAVLLSPTQALTSVFFLTGLFTEQAALVRRRRTSGAWGSVGPMRTDMLPIRPQI